MLRKLVLEKTGVLIFKGSYCNCAFSNFSQVLNLNKMANFGNFCLILDTPKQCFHHIWRTFQMSMVKMLTMPFKMSISRVICSQVGKLYQKQFNNLCKALLNNPCNIIISKIISFQS